MRLHKVTRRNAALFVTFFEEGAGRMPSPHAETADTPRMPRSIRQNFKNISFITINLSYSFIMAKDQVAVIIAQMHSVAFAIAEPFAVTAPVLLHP